ncbi:hypothetical protein G5V59_16205 [Nocardioides sp. W3-2-3]|uniref:hypothetical protein n=1 Tax=Nocardioides convexus TaxID=2712224 RepID=UPI0024187D71|nr:hypothetical protein [Nocardioides convexus]NHA00932.1 hypothetical protein [Nocardioides convexus]
MHQTLEALGASTVRNLRDLSATVVVDVDAQGRLRRRHTRILVQATSGTIHEIPYTDSSPEPTPEILHIQPGPGVRVARRHQHPGGRLFGVVFESRRATDRARHRHPRLVHRAARGLPRHPRGRPRPGPQEPRDPHLGALRARSPAGLGGGVRRRRLATRAP